MRQALLALITIGLVMSLAWAGSMAYFSDTETSSGNTLQAGTLDMEIRDFTGDESGTWKDGVTATWTLSGMIPGVSETGIQQIELRNIGSINADHLEITCSYTVDDTPDVESDTDWGTTGDDFAKYMEITLMEYMDDLWKFDLLTGEKYTREITGDPWVLTETQSKWKVEDQNDDGIVSLYDLNQDPLDDLTPPNGVTQFEMQLRFHEDAGNDLQGDTLNLTMIFTLKQDPSQ